MDSKFTIVSLLLVGLVLAIVPNCQSAPGRQPIQVGGHEVVKHKMDLNWEEYKLAYGKKYTGLEVERQHEEAFLKNKQMIQKHNAAFGRGETSYQLGFSPLSDLTEAEMDQRNGYKSKGTRKLHFVKSLLEFTQRGIDMDELPDEVDWRNATKELVTRVKDQGNCGSCWAFSTTGVLESAQAKATGELVELSEQNLVDCDKLNSGCNGGDELMSVYYVMEQSGINLEEDYPYVGKKQRCSFNTSLPLGATMVRQVVTIPYMDELALKAAVALEGPISVAIYAGGGFSSYSSGVYNKPGCPYKFTQLNHAVLVVGYGTDPEHGDFWLVKNSWGPQWGEKGYIRMARNKNNQCGIATEAFYAQ